jgi:hypothetical protein
MMTPFTEMGKTQKNEQTDGHIKNEKERLITQQGTQQRKMNFQDEKYALGILMPMSVKSSPEKQNQ